MTIKILKACKSPNCFK